MGQLEDLKLFVTIVESGSITRAADTAHIAKSAVSRRLGILEDRYGARLIDRAPGSWALTATGQELYHRALDLVGEFMEMEADFTSLPRDLAGPLSVSIPREFGIAFLSEALIAFKMQHPEIELSVDLDDRLVDLTRENYDLAIRITNAPIEGMVTNQIGATRHQLCASPQYLQARGQPATVKELASHALIYFGSARRATWIIGDRDERPVRVNFRPVINSNSGEFLLTAAKRGLGIALFPDFIARPSLAAGHLVPVLSELAFPDWGIFLVHSAKRRLNLRMRLFSEAMAAACSEGSQK